MLDCKKMPNRRKYGKLATLAMYQSNKDSCSGNKHLSLDVNIFTRQLTVVPEGDVCVHYGDYLLLSLLNHLIKYPLDPLHGWQVS